MSYEADDERDGGIAIGRPPLNPTLAQLEILLAVAELGSNKAVAYAFGLSERTVKCHVANILWRIQAKSRSHAVYLLWPILTDAFPLGVSFPPHPNVRTGWIRREADKVDTP